MPKCPEAPIDATTAGREGRFASRVTFDARRVVTVAVRRVGRFVRRRAKARPSTRVDRLLVCRREEGVVQLRADHIRVVEDVEMEAKALHVVGADGARRIERDVEGLLGRNDQARHQQQHVQATSKRDPLGEAAPVRLEGAC